VQQVFPARLRLGSVPGKDDDVLSAAQNIDGAELEVLEQQPAGPTSWKAKSLDIAAGESLRRLGGGSCSPE